MDFNSTFKYGTYPTKKVICVSKYILGIVATGLVAQLGTGCMLSIMLKFAVVPFHMVLISQNNLAHLYLIVTRTLPLSATYELLHNHVFLYSYCIVRYVVLFKALYSSPLADQFIPTPFRLL